MPLYVTNGKLQLGDGNKLAAQRACCCNEEGDNPGDCVCPDFCLYKVELVDPEPASQDPPLPCLEADITRWIDTSKCLDFDLQYSDGLIGAANPCEGLVGIYKTTTGVSAGWIACHQFCTGLTGAQGGARIPNTNLYAKITYNAAVYFYCADDFFSNTTARLVLEITWGAIVTVYGTFENAGIVGERNISKRLTIDPIPLQCGKKAGVTCLDGTDSSNIRAAYATGMPLNITVSHVDAGIGGWGPESTDTQSGDQTRVSEYIDNIISNFSVTFRITQRPSCRIVDCNCSTSLDGLKATFEGKEFTLGTEFPYSETFDDYELVTTHYRDFAGDYIFEKYKVLNTPAGAIGDVQSVKVFCETDTEADPQVPRWFAEFVSICRTVEANTNVSAETTRTEIGYFLCSESAGCAGRSEGDPVPLGTAQEIEEIPGSPETTSGKDPCTPPARASLTIFEDCG